MEITGDYCSVNGMLGRNEDYAIVDGSGGACLADGMGGEEMGGVIARCACVVAMRTIAGGGNAVDALENAQAFSRDLIRNLDCGRGGAALTVVHCNGDDVQVAWAGDVLCMRYDARQEELQVLTPPDRGRRGITNALGASDLRPNVADARLSYGDRLLICSDGVWENVDRKEIRNVLSAARTPREAAVTIAMGRQCADDATAVVLFAGADRTG